MIRYAVKRLEARIADSELGDLLGPEVSLVPAPRSAPMVPGGLWPAERIREALVAAGLGREVLRCLERVTPVEKSATALPGERPSAEEHYESIRARGGLRLAGARAVVVDDVITKGATCLASGGPLSEVFRDTDIRAFALVRTLGLVGEMPVLGRVEHRLGRIDRSP